MPKAQIVEKNRSLQKTRGDREILENKTKKIINRTRPILERKAFHKARKAALILACMTEDFVGEFPPESSVVSRSMLSAVFRIVHWVDEAVRCGQVEVLLRCLVEASCANLALRGLLMDDMSPSQQRTRRRALMMSQSRRFDGLIRELCELSGRKANRFESPILSWAVTGSC